MARLPKCPDCEKDIVDKTVSKKVGGRWVCPDCLEVREKAKADREELYEYVSELFKVDFPSMMMMTQIRDFREDRGYTYKGMTLALEYWIDTLGNDMSNAKGVGIIPYIYEDAKNFYIEKLNVRRSLENMEQPLTTDRTVQVKRTDLNKNSKPVKGLIDMNDL